jgi:N-acetylneuraminic acid mutarotase
VAAGTTTITASAGGKSGTASLTVNAATVSWVAKKDMPTARDGATAAVVNGIIYVIGGADPQTNSLNPHLAVVEAYDPVANTWTTKTPMPGARSFLSSAVVNNVIYVFGGDNAVSSNPSANTFAPVVTVQAYDPVANTWTTKASMTIARERFAIAESGGVIYVLGGLIPSGSFVDVTATMHAYNLSTNTWSTKASMGTARNDLTAVALNGVIYAISGQSSTAVEAYDIASNTWSVKGSLTQINSQPIGSFASGGLVYAMDSFPFIETYSPATNLWTAKTGVRTGFTSRSWATLSIVGTTMYVIGGTDSFGVMKTVEARAIP